MKIIDGIILTDVGSDWVAVPIGEAAKVLHGIVRLNDTAKFVWDELAKGCTQDELVERMLAAYDVDEAKAKNAVAKVVSQLKDAGLIED